MIVHNNKNNKDMCIWYGVYLTGSSKKENVYIFSSDTILYTYKYNLLIREISFNTFIETFS